MKSLFIKQGDEMFIPDRLVYQSDIKTLQEHFPEGSQVYYRDIISDRLHENPMKLKFIIELHEHGGLKHAILDGEKNSTFLGNICFKISQLRNEKLKLLLK